MKTGFTAETQRTQRIRKKKMQPRRHGDTEARSTRLELIYHEGTKTRRKCEDFKDWFNRRGHGEHRGSHRERRRGWTTDCTDGHG